MEWKRVRGRRWEGRGSGRGREEEGESEGRESGVQGHNSVDIGGNGM